MAKAQKILDTGKVRIVVDHRESKNHVFRNLRDFDADLVRKQLKTGDYICSDRVCVERKTIPDFVQSIIDQRIFKQVNEISECFEKPLLIIEGNPDLLFLERNVHPNMIRGALASLAIDHKIPIIWTRNSLETANQIYWIAYREQGETKPRNPLFKEVRQRQQPAGIPDSRASSCEHETEQKPPQEIQNPETRFLSKAGKTHEC